MAGKPAYEKEKKKNRLKEVKMWKPSEDGQNQWDKVEAKITGKKSVSVSVQIFELDCSSQTATF